MAMPAFFYINLQIAHFIMRVTFATTKPIPVATPTANVVAFAVAVVVVVTVFLSLNASHIAECH